MCRGGRARPRFGRDEAGRHWPFGRPKPASTSCSARGLARPRRYAGPRGPHASAAAVKKILPAAEIVALKGVGHLAHEEKPPLVAEVLLDAVRRDGLLPAASPT